VFLIHNSELKMVGKTKTVGNQRKDYLNKLADKKGIVEYKDGLRVLPYTLTDLIANAKRDNVTMPKRSALNRWLKRNGFCAVGAIYKGNAPIKNEKIWLGKPSDGGLDTKYVSTSVRIQSKHGRTILNFGIVTLMVDGVKYSKFYPNVKARVSTMEATEYLYQMTDLGIWEKDKILFVDKEFNHLTKEGYKITNAPNNVFHAVHKDKNNVERVFGQLTNNTYPKIRQLKKVMNLSNHTVRKNTKWAVKVGLIYMEALENLGHIVIDKIDTLQKLKAIEVVEIEERKIIVS